MSLDISPDYKRGHGRAKDMLSERQYPFSSVASS
jgi:hypothetical protein